MMMMMMTILGNVLGICKLVTNSCLAYILSFIVWYQDQNWVADVKVH